MLDKGNALDEIICEEEECLLACRAVRDGKDDMLRYARYDMLRYQIARLGFGFGLVTTQHSLLTPTVPRIASR